MNKENKGKELEDTRVSENTKFVYEDWNDDMF